MNKEKIKKEIISELQIFLYILGKEAFKKELQNVINSFNKSKHNEETKYGIEAAKEFLKSL